MPLSKFPQIFPNINESVLVACHEDPVTASISIHSHSFIEFAYVAEGYGVETINQSIYQMKPGYFSIIYPWQTHELHLRNDTPVKYYFVAISMDNFLGAGSVAIELKDLFLLAGGDTPSNHYFDAAEAARLNATFHDMYEEFTTRRKWWELAVKSRIIDIMVLFDRHMHMENKAVNKPVNNTATRQTMDIIFYIYHNFKDDLSLPLLSKHFGLSENYLSTIIKASLGTAFLDFLQNLRLKYACTLLVSTPVTVTDVAYSAGFQSYRNFVRYFTKHYGMSPTGFRKMHGK